MPDKRDTSPGISAPEIREGLLRLRDSSIRTDSGGAFRLSEAERGLLADTVNALSRELLSEEMVEECDPDATISEPGGRDA